MKSLAFALCLLASTASAETLPVMDCGKFRVCNGATSINADVSGTAVSVDFGGVVYANPYGNAATIVGLPLYATDGTFVTLNATFVQQRKLIHSGHNYYVTVWVLTSGSVT